MKFSEVIGHDRWKAYFDEAIRGDRLAHAYLLIGPEGVGKWTFAQALAERIVCARPCGADACGECGPCKRVHAATHPDVARIDPKSEGERGMSVETARERVMTAFRLRPSEAPLRIVLLNDADRMEPAAQNALLKTLEEPPPRSLLILVAREAGLLLDTVVSRCFLLRFAPVAESALAAWLRQRGFSAEDAGALAALAEGVPGRALAWSEEQGRAADDLRRRILDGSIDLQALGKAMSGQADEQAESSAFERRRRATWAMLAGLAHALRTELVKSDRVARELQLDRVVTAGVELAAASTPELVLDRLALDLAPPAAPRAR